MSAVTKLRQQGSTLPVSMIMLVAITLLVVFAIRSGNTNLRIAGNSQKRVESHQAIQQAIEQTVEEISAVDDPSLIPAQTVPVTMGAASYTVNVEPMATCANEMPVVTAELDEHNANDVACIGGSDGGDRAELAAGGLSAVPSECKQQDWEIRAGVNDGLTGAKSDQVQGVTIRVSSTVNCLLN